ncbi:MAG: prolipoprotein diacylglyceryl transferase [Thomasclavelia sp.]|nr:prolipoprotein diacylglyceryl transferase [Thomasclavelia sp.]
MQLFPDSKTFIELGPLSIQWYALLILTGAIIAYLLGQYNFKKLGYNKEILSDYFFGLMAVGIIGARIWYVIFMWQELYAAHPEEIIMINHGGLAIQGGIVFGLIFSYWYFKKKNISFLEAGDAIMPGVLIAQAFGRWGNFFNQEAHGGEVSLKFLKSLHLPNFIIEGMHIDGVYYHPTFLYESVGCVIGFLLIILVVRKLANKTGYEFFSYFIWYGIIRFFIEGLRTDSLYFLGLRMAQLTSIAFIILGIIGFIYVYKWEPPKKRSYKPD